MPDGNVGDRFEAAIFFGALMLVNNAADCPKQLFVGMAGRKDLPVVLGAALLVQAYFPECRTLPLVFCGRFLARYAGFPYV
jgi:hypothetical protein